MTKLYSNIYIILIFALCLSTSLYVDYHFVSLTAGKWYLGIYLFFILVIMYPFFCSYKFISLFIHISICSTFLLSIYGLIQFILINYKNGEEVIMGNFDNPAGYASSLCAGFPMLLYFFNRTKRYIYSSVIIGSLITLSVILSESRAGMLSIITMIIVWILLKIKINLKILFLLLVGTTLLIVVLYFYKKQSADGRLLIWECSWEMIKDKPLLGYGIGGFRANYMDYQANYFKRNPESSYALLADNTSRPFNEYILLLVNYGFIGFILFITFTYFLWKCYQRNPCLESKLALICLIGIAVFASFSYPLSYPFVWVMIIFSIYTLLVNANYIIKLTYHTKKIIRLSIILISLIIFVRVSEKMTNQYLWAKTAKQSLIRQTDTTFAHYNKLFPELKNDYLFLYNYASELNYGGYFQQSQQIAMLCQPLSSDYDLQLLMGDNYVKMNQYKMAEKHFQQAAYMCPVRFIPLYELMKIYQLKGEHTKAKEIAKTILNKPVKIHSKNIEQIKQEAEKLHNRLIYNQTISSIQK